METYKKIKELRKLVKNVCAECLEKQGYCDYCKFFDVNLLVVSIYHDVKECKDKNQIMN